MAGYNRSLYQPMAAEPGLVEIYGEFTTTTSGTIDTAATSGGVGITSIVKTASKTGRYTITLASTFKKLKFAEAIIIGADDAAFTDAKGCDPRLRDDDIASDGTIELQFVDADSGADAELQDAAKVLFKLVLKNTSV